MDILKKQIQLQMQGVENYGDSAVAEEVEQLLSDLEKNNYTGIFQVSDQAYHLGPGISKSTLDQINKNPNKYIENCISHPLKEPTEAMKIGDLVHKALLEPHLVNEKYISDEKMYKALAPKYKNPRACKEYKEQKKLIEDSGKYVINFEDFQMMEQMRMNVADHPVCRQILEHGMAEKAVYAVCPDSGLLLRCKPDWLMLGQGIIADLKTTADASYDEFSKSAYNFRYYVQAAFYAYVVNLATGTEISMFPFICLEKKAPYDVAIYQIDDAALELGAKHMVDNLTKYRDCLEQDEWYGYPREVQQLALPHWVWYNE